MTTVLVHPNLIPKTPEEAWQFYAKASGIDPSNRVAYLAFMSGTTWAASTLWNTFNDHGAVALDEASDAISEYEPREQGVG